MSQFTHNMRIPSLLRSVSGFRVQCNLCLKRPRMVRRALEHIDEGLRSFHQSIACLWLCFAWHEPRLRNEMELKLSTVRLLVQAKVREDG